MAGSIAECMYKDMFVKIEKNTTSYTVSYYEYYNAMAFLKSDSMTKIEIKDRFGLAV